MSPVGSHPVAANFSRQNGLSFLRSIARLGTVCLQCSLEPGAHLLISILCHSHGHLPVLKTVYHMSLACAKAFQPHVCIHTWCPAQTSLSQDLFWPPLLQHNVTDRNSLELVYQDVTGCWSWAKGRDYAGSQGITNVFPLFCYGFLPILAPSPLNNCVSKYSNSAPKFLFYILLVELTITWKKTQITQLGT